MNILSIIFPVSSLILLKKINDTDNSQFKHELLNIDKDLLKKYSSKY